MHRNLVKTLFSCQVTSRHFRKSLDLTNLVLQTEANSPLAVDSCSMHRYVSGAATLMFLSACVFLQMSNYSFKLKVNSTLNTKHTIIFCLKKPSLIHIGTVCRFLHLTHKTHLHMYSICTWTQRHMTSAALSYLNAPTLLVQLHISFALFFSTDSHAHPFALSLDYKFAYLESISW